MLYYAAHCGTGVVSTLRISENKFVWTVHERYQEFKIFKVHFFYFYQKENGSLTLNWFVKKNWTHGFQLAISFQSKERFSKFW